MSAEYGVISGILLYYSVPVVACFLYSLTCKYRLVDLWKDLKIQEYYTPFYLDHKHLRQVLCYFGSKISSLQKV